MQYCQGFTDCKECEYFQGVCKHPVKQCPKCKSFNTVSASEDTFKCTNCNLEFEP